MVGGISKEELVRKGVAMEIAEQIEKNSAIEYAKEVLSDLESVIDFEGIDKAEFEDLVMKMLLGGKL